MIGLLGLFLAFVVAPFKSKSRLEAENAALRHQLIVLRRKVQGGPGSRTAIAGSLSSCIDGFRRFCRSSRSFSRTLVRWHRAGFRRYWCWKSRLVGGRPQINAELRALIRRMSSRTRCGGTPYPRRTAQARL